MPNLVGTGLNQVPTNSMLGGLAYQDPEHASIKNLDLKNLSQINSEIADTAVDVFVYDTSKDSDGGAWRKRTQNTSWYNETLNTATRGSRKEFPAIAVIVAEATKVTIYDGDDPDLPMWMTFEPNGIIDWPTSNVTKINISALNGILTTVTNDGGHLFKFVEDYVEIIYSSQNYNISSGRTIADRNDSTSYATVSGTALRVYKVVTYNMNDVAMTVLPNAPIDDATGLPIPTIAVGTEGGVSVIKDDGIVVDVIHTSFKNITQIFFTEDNLLAYLAANTVNQTYGFHYVKIPSGDLDNGTDGRNVGSYDVRFYNGDGRNYTPSLGSRAYGHNFIDGAIGYNDASSGGLTLLEKDVPQDYENSSIAFVNTDFNTGWMHGDCKGAFLSDAVTEKDGVNYALSALNGGTNRLTSLTYSDGDTDWQMVDNASTSNGYVNVDMRGLTIGQTYKISMTWNNNAVLDSNYYHRVAHLNGLSGENGTDFTHWNKTNGSSETLTGIFTAQSVNDDDLIIYANAITLNISNFKIEETDDINGKELITNGTFDSNVNNWVENTSTNTYSSGKMQITRSGGTGATSYQAFTTISGIKYVARAEVNSSGSRGDFYIKNGTGWSGTTLGNVTGTNGQTKILSTTFIATSTTSSVSFAVDSDGTSIIVDNVSVRLAEEDRSVNNKGLQVFGTVTKSAVATGAELVAYSGFSNSNYLMQPHNTDLEIGTGEISISAWFKSSTSDTGNYKGLFYLNNPGSLGPGLQVMFGPSNGIYFYVYGASGSQNFGGSYHNGYNDGNWHQVVVSTKPGQQQIYVDGVLKQTGTVNTGSMTNTSSEIYIGRWYGNANVSSYWWRGDIALVRVSRSIPSAEQIKKMYEDEKVLFQENAKATLYGSSDAVTALTFDDTTELLHVGTSSGRSDFQGLSRINNTTDAVTTAISASNGLVAEQ